MNAKTPRTHAKTIRNERSRSCLPWRFSLAALASWRSSSLCVSASPRWINSFRNSRRRVEDDLDAAVHLLAEDVVPARRLAQWDAVRDDEAGVDPAAADV